MKLSTLLFLLFLSVQLSAQGWVWQSGTPESEALRQVWADSDSTVIGVGDSAKTLVWKRFHRQGQLLASKQVGTISSNASNAVFTKKDFGFVFLIRYTQAINWTTYNSFNFYQLRDTAGNMFATGGASGQNSKPCCNQQTGGWIKELHDSTKNLTGLRIFPAPGNRYVILATRSGNIGSTYIAETGFLLINATGDLLESNWIPNGISPNAEIPITQDADGFSLLKEGELFRFDALGHLLWSKEQAVGYSL